MIAPEPVTTFAELDCLDQDDIDEGYWEGRQNAPEPGHNRGKAYWHGWRNGMVDGGHAQPDAAMLLLIADVRRNFGFAAVHRGEVAGAVDWG
jgi:hypothetical protein